MMQEGVGVVLSSAASHKRVELGHHGQQHVELVGGALQVHKHALPQQLLSYLPMSSWFP